MIELTIGIIIGALLGLIIASLVRVSALSDLVIENELMRLENKIREEQEKFKQPISQNGDIK